MKFFRRFFILLIILVAIFGGIRLYYNLTDDFRLANISYDMPNRAEWEIELPSNAQLAEIDQILSQPFYYIGKGAQSYAFGSEDGKSVIKFFKFKHLRPSWMLDFLPSFEPFESYRNTQERRKERKLEGVFAGYLLAYKVHRDDSGLIFIHLNKTKDQFPIVQVYDKLGLRHQINLNDVVFILQRRVETARNVIHRHLQNNDVAGAKEKIDAIFALYKREYAKGIFDNDHGVMRNVGFSGDQPIHLDVGKLKKSNVIHQPDVYAKDLEMAAKRMKAWLQEHELKHFPELKAHIDSTLGLSKKF
jgi:hypothetical protein